jgi:hypothetical protein
VIQSAGTIQAIGCHHHHRESVTMKSFLDALSTKCATFDGRAWSKDSDAGR